MCAHEDIVAFPTQIGSNRYNLYLGDEGGVMAQVDVTGVSDFDRRHFAITEQPEKISQPQPERVTSRRSNVQILLLVGLLDLRQCYGLLKDGLQVHKSPSNFVKDIQFVICQKMIGYVLHGKQGFSSF